MPDSSGHRLNGTYVNNPTLGTQGVSGKCAVFAGYRDSQVKNQGSYAEVPDADVFSQPTPNTITVMAWIRPDVLDFPACQVDDANGSFAHIIGKGESDNMAQEWAWRLYTENPGPRSNRIGMYVWNLNGGEGSAAEYQDPMTAGQWVFVVTICNATDIKLYKNGTLRNTVPLTEYDVHPKNGTEPFRIATRNMQDFFSGAFDEVVILNYEPTETQLLNLYQIGYGLLKQPPSVGGGSANISVRFDGEYL